MTPRADFSSLECSIARTLEVVGDRWSLLVIRDAFYGLRRFDEFQRDLGVARNVLSSRLHKLVDAGILEKVQYGDRPARFEYHLSDKGRDLLSVILTMMAWGDRWQSGDDEAPVRLHHLTCGTNDVHAEVTCSACDQELALPDLVTDPIPVLGARRLPDLLSAAEPAR